MSLFRNKLVYVKVLTQAQLDLSVIQAVASALITISQRIGSESTASYILPQLKLIFDELAFSQPTTSLSGSSGKISKISASKSEEKFEIRSRMEVMSYWN